MAIKDGNLVKIKFTEALVGNPTGRDPVIEYDTVVLKEAELKSIKSSDTYSSSYPITRLNDGVIGQSTSYCWRSKSASCSITLALHHDERVVGVMLYLYSAFVNTLQMYYSDDDVNWVQIGDVVTRKEGTANGWYQFDVDNESESHKYWKVEVLTASTTYVYIAELQMVVKRAYGTAKNFKATFDTYEYYPSNKLVTETRTPIRADLEDNDVLVLTFDDGNVNSIQNAVGDIEIEYDGAGGIMGFGGPVAAFSESFSPVSLGPKFNPISYEHITVDADVISELIEIALSDNSYFENIEIDCEVIAELKSVDDI